MEDRKVYIGLDQKYHLSLPSCVPWHIPLRASISSSVKWVRLRKKALRVKKCSVNKIWTMPYRTTHPSLHLGIVGKNLHSKALRGGSCLIPGPKQGTLLFPRTYPHSQTLFLHVDAEPLGQMEWAPSAPYNTLPSQEEFQAKFILWVNRRWQAWQNSFSLHDWFSPADQLHANEDVPELTTKTLLNNLEL